MTYDCISIIFLWTVSMSSDGRWVNGASAVLCQVYTEHDGFGPRCVMPGNFKQLAPSQWNEVMSTWRPSVD